MAWFVEYLRRCYALLSPDDRRRWIRLIPLVALTSAIEAAGTVAIFILVASLADPEAVFDMPVVGERLAAIGAGDPQQLRIVMVVLVGLFYIAKGALFAVSEYAQASASEHTASNLSVRLLSAYLRAPYLFHVGRNATDLVHTATYVAGTTFGHVIAAMVHIATEVLVFAGILAVLLTAAPGMTLGAGGVLVFLGTLVVLGMKRVSARLGRQSQELGASGMRQQALALSAVDEITVLGRSSYFIERFAALSSARAEVDAKGRFFGALPRITVETIFICGALFATLGLMLAGATSGRTVSLLGLFAYAGFRIIPSANRVLMNLHVLRHGEAGIDRIRCDLADAEEASRPTSGVDPAWDFRSVLSFDRVSLAYPDQDECVLRDVSLKIRRGESLAIVGETGSGKSSLIRLLVGLVEPTEGAIEIDGKPLPSVLGSWRARLGYVPQEVHLVEDSLRRNIAFGVADDEIDDQAVREAIERAQLSELLAGLPQGLDTNVGDRGIRLSGGERQRVGIARSMYHRPHVVVLDEATSSLDPGTEAQLLSTISSELREWTLVAVTHRVASVRGFDRIAFVDDGRIEAVGNFDELAETVEEFRRVARIGSAE